MSTLKRIRDGLVCNLPAQRIIRAGARSGVIPRAAYGRLPALGAHPVTTPAGNVVTYVADDRDMLARKVVWGNLRHWESGSLRVFSDLARTSALFLDVGAYSGVYSLIACADGAGEAIAFEPNPDTLPLLRRNIQVNRLQSRIKVVAKGASDRQGVASMTIPADRTAARVDPLGDGPEIELTTIDTVAAGRRVDIIKIDVEGLEPEVLRGGSNTLLQYRPAIIAEALSAEAFDRTSEVAGDLGYDRCDHLAPEGPIPTERYIDAPPHANFLWRSTAR